MKLKDVVFEVSLIQELDDETNIWKWITSAEANSANYIFFEGSYFCSKAEAIENAKNFFTENDFKFTILGE